MKLIPKSVCALEEQLVAPDGYFAHAHTSTICQTDAGMLAAWVAGHRADKSDSGIWLARRAAIGARWQSPTLVASACEASSTDADGDQQGDQQQGPRRCWNPVLFQPPGDANLLLFLKIGTSPARWSGEVMLSRDGGETFFDRQPLPAGFVGPVRSKPILVADQTTLLCPSSSESDGWSAYFESASIRDGQLTGSWNRSPIINDPAKLGVIQPTLLRLSDGTIGALCRTDHGYNVWSESPDLGKTWSAPWPTDLPNPNSAIDAVTLRDGRHLLAYNPTRGGESKSAGRQILSVAISDDGRVWRRAIDLEADQSGEYCYPSVIQTRDDVVHIVYTWHHRAIKHVALDPAKL